MRLFGRFLETGSGSSYETGFKPQGHDELRSGSFSQVHFAYGFVDLGECYKITKDGVKRQKTDIRQDTRGTSPRALHPNKPKLEQFGKPTSDSIPTIIRLFKSACTIQINAFRNMPRFPVWQRGYYEHVIRDERELEKTREYIVNNPLKWDLDRFNPDKISHPNKR